jgi:hypothetical protein
MLLLLLASQLLHWVSPSSVKSSGVLSQAGVWGDHDPREVVAMVVTGIMPGGDVFLLFSSVFLSAWSFSIFLLVVFLAFLVPL